MDTLPGLQELFGRYFPRVQRSDGSKFKAPDSFPDSPLALGTLVRLSGGYPSSPHALLDENLRQASGCMPDACREGQLRDVRRYLSQDHLERNFETELNDSGVPCTQNPSEVP